MKKKILLFFVCACCFSFATMAQLTTGSNTANVVRTGNRATAGDYGLYFGTTSDIFSKVGNPNVSMTFLPLVNLKYMQTNNLELRIGVELNKSKEVVAGDVKDAMDPDKMLDRKLKRVDAEHIIYPGFAYHFSKNNILDVYAGAELPLGYTRNSNIHNFDGDNSYARTTQMYYNVGLGGFIGLQAYVANLPIAIGFEYGIATMFDFGNKIKTETKADADSDVQTVYHSGLGGFGTSFEDIKTARKGELGSQFRFTLTYFFKK